MTAEELEDLKTETENDGDDTEDLDNDGDAENGGNSAKTPVSLLQVWRFKLYKVLGVRGWWQRERDPFQLKMDPVQSQPNI